jgi:surfeit locus 1 family protein
VRIWLAALLCLVGVAGLSALGVWQLERRVWKLALIERVEQRVHAVPVAAPGPAEWRTLTAANAEYRRVTVTGRFLEDRDTRVRAVTALGGGFWVMTPFRTDTGFTVLVNRGFVPPEQLAASKTPTLAAPASAASMTREAAPRGVVRASSSESTDLANVTLTGLLRMSEPKGGFLHANDPTANRWYSRDVAAISHAQGLSATAPYFIDADATAAATAAVDEPHSARPINNPLAPVGGLTVITFHNSHLLYAVTWFALALLVAGFGTRIARHELRLAGSASG